MKSQKLSMAVIAFSFATGSIASSPASAKDHVTLNASAKLITLAWSYDHKDGWLNYETEYQVRFNNLNKLNPVYIQCKIDINLLIKPAYNTEGGTAEEVKIHEITSPVIAPSHSGTVNFIRRGPSEYAARNLRCFAVTPEQALVKTLNGGTILSDASVNIHEGPKDLPVTDPATASALKNLASAGSSAP